MSKNKTKVRLLLVDNGVYHHEDIEISTELMEQHPRLIDCLREDPLVPVSYTHLTLPTSDLV